MGVKEKYIPESVPTALPFSSTPEKPEKACLVRPEQCGMLQRYLLEILTLSSLVLQARTWGKLKIASTTPINTGCDD